MQDHRQDDRHDEIIYEPVPGFRTAFHVILLAAVIYLAILFLL